MATTPAEKWRGALPEIVAREIGKTDIPDRNRRQAIASGVERMAKNSAESYSIDRMRCAPVAQAE